MKSYKLMGLDELELFVSEYPVKDEKGVVICVHGMCEHSERYKEFAEFLNAQGFGVVTYDQRGHRKSLLKGEEKGYLGKDGFNKIVGDLSNVVNYMKEKHPETRVYLLGHSMGSFVVTRYLQTHDKVDGVVLSGSNYGFKLLRIGTVISKLACIFKGEKKPGKLLDTMSFGSYNKVFAPNRTTFDWLTRDEAIVDKYIEDEFCGFVCSNRFYYDFFKGLLTIGKKKNMAQISPNTPIFIISGEQDPVGSLGEGAKALYNVLKETGKNAQLKLYPECRHEILNELNKLDVYRDIVNWLNTI